MEGAPFVARLAGFKLAGAELLSALPALFNDAHSDGVEDEGAMTIPFGSLDPADGIGVRGGAQLAAGDTAEVVGDDVVIADALTLAMNAVEKLDELDGLDVEAGFFADFAHCAGGERFTEFEHAAGERPVALEWLGAAADQKHAGVLDDDCANADEGRRGKFAINGSVHVQGRRGVLHKGNAQAPAVRAGTPARQLARTQALLRRSRWGGANRLPPAIIK